MNLNVTEKLLEYCKSKKNYKTQTEVYIYKSNVCSVLFYGSEIWKTSARCESRLGGSRGAAWEECFEFIGKRATNVKMTQRMRINTNDETGTRT